MSGIANNVGYDHRPAIERITKIVGHLKLGKKVTVKALAAEFEVSTKTINRDMDFMRDRLLIPLQYDSATFSWIIDPAAKVPWCYL